MRYGVKKASKCFKHRHTCAFDRDSIGQKDECNDTHIIPTRITYALEKPELANKAIHAAVLSEG